MLPQHLLLFKIKIIKYNFTNFIIFFKLVFLSDIYISFDCSCIFNSFSKLQDWGGGVDKGHLGFLGKILKLIWTYFKSVFTMLCITAISRSNL